MRSGVGRLVSSEASLLGLQVAALLLVLTYLPLTSVLSVLSVLIPSCKDTSHRIRARPYEFILT